MRTWYYIKHFSIGKIHLLSPRLILKISCLDILETRHGKKKWLVPKSNCTFEFCFRKRQRLCRTEWLAWAKCTQISVRNHSWSSKLQRLRNSLIEFTGSLDVNGLTIISSFLLTSNQSLALPSIMNVGKKSHQGQQNLWTSSIEITYIFIPHHSCCSCLQIMFVLIVTLRLWWLLEPHQTLLLNMLIKTYMVLQDNFFP